MEDERIGSRDDKMNNFTSMVKWEETVLGNSSLWPSSFRNYFGFVMNAELPMFFFWGADMLLFYNKKMHENFSFYLATVPIPGQPAARTFNSLWRYLHPVVKKIYEGNNELTNCNHVFKIKTSDKDSVLWNIRFCAAYNELGKINGILATVSNEENAVNLSQQLDAGVNANKQQKTANDVIGKKTNTHLVINTEERLQLVLSANDLGSWELNLKTHEVKYSKKYLEILGYDQPQELGYEELLRHVHPADLKVRENAMKRALDGEVLNYELRLVWRNGSIRWVEARGKVFYDENGQPEKLVGTYRDITEQRARVEGLRESEQKFRILADSVPQLIWTGDLYGNLNYFNLSLFEYSGLTPSQIHKEGWMQIVHPEDRLESVKQWANAIDFGLPFLIEHRLKRFDGEYRWHLSRALAQKDNNSEIQMWVGTSTDVHDQKVFSEELEKNVGARTTELKQAIKELVKTNQELEQFAYVSSHDLQEPLRKIQTFSGILSEKLKTDTDSKIYLDKINSSANRMSELIRDLLDYSRLSRTEEHYTEVNLNGILEKVKSDFEVLIQQKKAIIISTKLPAIRAIPIQINQLVYNLIGNSLKFCDKKPFIEVSAKKASQSDIRNTYVLKPDKKYYHIMFKDNGIGFSQEYSQQIFTIFQRLNDLQKYSGTGIGLAMCKKIVENHDGFINAESESGMGATFNVFLPY